MIRAVEITVFLLFFGSFSTFSQGSEEDTLRKWFPQKLGKANWKPSFGFDARRSWYAGNPIKISGYRLGATYKGIHRFGLGYYYLKRKSLYDDVVVGLPDEASPVIVKYRINAIAAYYDRTIYKSSKWHITIPLVVSFGQIRGLYLTDLGLFSEYYKRPYSAISTGIDAHYYVFPWLAPRIHIGYRLTFNTSIEVKKTFDRIYYAYGISVLPFELKKWIEKRQAEGRSIFDPRP